MTLISLTADAHENSIKWSSYSVEDLKVAIANVDKIHYLTFCTFSFEFKKVACLIQDVVSHHTVVIKEWRDVARDLLCRTTLS